MKKYLKVKHSWKKEIDENIALFLAFHDYYKNVEDKEKNDGCLEKLIKKVVYIASHKEKYNVIKKSSPLFDNVEDAIKWLED